jgi:fructokinase
MDPRDNGAGGSLMTVRIGIDFGGTKIEGAALDPAGGIVTRIRVPNPGGYDAALAVLVDLVARIEAEAEPAASVGIGSPGSLSPRNELMRNSNSLYLNGRPFLQDVQVALGRPVRLANDANCMALSEAIDGAAAGRRSVFGLIIGTGCGGGLVLDGRVVEGAHGIAGEIGHIPLPWPGTDEMPAPGCWCGLHGCFESWVSGTGFSRAFAALTGRPLDAPAIVAAARSGDGEAMAALDRYIDRLGRGLALLANLIDPDAIVIGGGMSNVEEIYAGLPEVVRRHTFSGQWDGAIVPARWGDSSGVRGAALLWGE